MSEYYVYIWNGVRHIKTDTEYLKGLGMSDDGIKVLQEQAKPVVSLPAEV